MAAKADALVKRGDAPEFFRRGKVCSGKRERMFASARAGGASAAGNLKSFGRARENLRGRQNSLRKLSLSPRGGQAVVLWIPAAFQRVGKAMRLSGEASRCFHVGTGRCRGSRLMNFCMCGGISAVLETQRKAGVAEMRKAWKNMLLVPWHRARKIFFCSMRKE